MNFKSWLDILENGGTASSGASASGSASGSSVSSSSGTSSTSSSPGSSSNSASSSSKGMGTSSKDIAKVPSKCCGWGIWLDPKKRKRN